MCFSQILDDLAHSEAFHPGFGPQALVQGANLALRELLVLVDFDVVVRLHGFDEGAVTRNSAAHGLPFLFQFLPHKLSRRGIENERPRIHGCLIHVPGQPLLQPGMNGTVQTHVHPVFLGLVLGRINIHCVFVTLVECRQHTRKHCPPTDLAIGLNVS